MGMPDDYTDECNDCGSYNDSSIKILCKECIDKRTNDTIDSFWINDYDELKHDRNLMFTSLKVKLKEAFT